MFDDFLVDMFGNNQNLASKLGLKDLTLDKQLIIKTAKKQRIDQLMASE